MLQGEANALEKEGLLHHQQDAQWVHGLPHSREGHLGDRASGISLPRSAYRIGDLKNSVKDMDLSDDFWLLRGFSTRSSSAARNRHSLIPRLRTGNNEANRGSSAGLILLANLGESDEAAEQQVHCEYSRIGEPS